MFIQYILKNDKPTYNLSNVKTWYYDFNNKNWNCVGEIIDYTNFDIPTFEIDSLMPNDFKKLCEGLVLNHCKDNSLTESICEYTGIIDLNDFKNGLIALKLLDINNKVVHPQVK